MLSCTSARQQLGFVLGFAGVSGMNRNEPPTSLSICGSLIL